LAARHRLVEDGGRIRIRCTYTVPVDFYVWVYQWTFSHDVDRPIFVV